MGKGPLKSKMKREIEVQPSAAAEPKSSCGSETFSHCCWKKKNNLYRGHTVPHAGNYRAGGFLWDWKVPIS